MKLSDILEGDVVDFGAKRKEQEFIKKVGDMSKANDPSNVAQDIEAAEGRDAELAQEVMVKYGRQLKELSKFLDRPVMAGGFQNARMIADVIKGWLPRKEKSKLQVARAVKKVVDADDFFKEVRKHNSLWRAVTNHYPMEVIWALPSVDDFDDIEQLYQMLKRARDYYEKDGSFQGSIF